VQHHSVLLRETFVLLQICVHVLVMDLFQILFTLGRALTGVVKWIFSWKVLDTNLGFTVGVICEYQPKIIDQRIYSLNQIKNLIFTGRNI
jgi:hypothetical protein